MTKKLRIPLLLALAVLITGLGYDMLSRARQELLWGYRPLFLLLAGWAAVVLLLAFYVSRNPQRWRWLGLSTLSGVILALGFPGAGLPLPLLMFAGFVPLWIAGREIADRYAAPADSAPASSGRPSAASLSPSSFNRTGGWQVFAYSYHAFVVWNILTTFWVANSALAAGVFAVMVNSALMCLPVVLFHYTRRLMPRLGYAVFVAYWIAFEYGHMNWDLTWPWLTLGNSFAEWPRLVQWYEYTGVFGGTLWILLMNILALRLWDDYRSGRTPRANGMRFGALLAGPAAFSLLLFYSYRPPAGGTIDVVVVQPNYEPHFEKFSVPEEVQAPRYQELAARKLDAAADYLVFPETSFGYVDVAGANDYFAIRSLRRFLADFPRANLVTGLNAYEVIPPGEPHTPATRAQARGAGDTLYYEVLNAAAQISPGDSAIQWYRKSKLVPGPEIFPFRRAMWFFGPLVRRLGGTWEGVGTQPRRSVFRGPAARVGTAICYESVFGAFYGGYVRQGAQAMFIITNDGWWDRTPGHRQHLHFASLRAIETRRDIARSANTGISCFVDQRGLIRQATRYGEPAVIRDTLHLNDALTMYVRWGDVIARIAVFATGLLLLNTLVRSLTGKS